MLYATKLPADLLKSFVCGDYKIWQSTQDETTQNDTSSKYKSQIEVHKGLRRENSSNNITYEFAEGMHKRCTHPLSKISLMNKVYFTILLISKIHQDNFLKVLQYFQNYYPQDFDDNCSICNFLMTRICENLKGNVEYSPRSSFMGQEFLEKF